MIGSQEALDIVLSNIIDFGSRNVHLNNSIERILDEDIIADRPFPPFDRVCMDGIAISYDSYNKGRRSSDKESLAAAGDVQHALTNVDRCIEIMTGAPLPDNTDTIIRYEDLQEEESRFIINAEVKKGQNIHYKASDHLKGKVLMKKGLPSEDFHLKDDAGAIQSELTDILEQFDVILLCGSVSKGKLDFIPDVLERLGVTKLFHGLKQRPGKPFWFGRIKNKVIFAFPGNPVSSLTCLHKYFIPWYYKCLKIDINKWKAQLASDVYFKPDLTYFAQVTVDQKADGTLQALVAHGNGSGEMVNPSRMDGFRELARGSDYYNKGELYRFYPFHSIL